MSVDSEKPVIVLFRHDLRIADNRALYMASRSGRPVVPVFLWDEETSPDIRPIGGARRWWLHHSLTALAASLRGLGTTLILKRGRTDAVVDSLIAETGADTVVWNRRYDPPGFGIDTALQQGLSRRSVVTQDFEGQLLHEPSALKTCTGGYYRVYTPFWRAMNAGPEPRDPLSAPQKLVRWHHETSSEKLEDWALLPKKPNWAECFREDWAPGELGAHERLEAFLDDVISKYPSDRDRPSIEATSRLSPHLAHGEITPFQIWHATRSAKLKDESTGVEKFRKELAWREFSYHLLFHNPGLHLRNFNSSFDAFPWKNDADQFFTWKRGMTGYPIVDAGMRQLWQTGWMHNRVRMIVASFLIKHLLIDWRKGEEWFWNTLVDADAANNAASWQWVAGSGADAAPYFRVFNPVLQGEKFDLQGCYVRKFVPELNELPVRYLHQPWTAPEAILRAAHIELGKNYPKPIVEHTAARRRALDAYAETRHSNE